MCMSISARLLIPEDNEHPLMESILNGIYSCNIDNITESEINHESKRYWCNLGVVEIILDGSILVLNMNSDEETIFNAVKLACKTILTDYTFADLQCRRRFSLTSSNKKRFGELISKYNQLTYTILFSEKENCEIYRSGFSLSYNYNKRIYNVFVNILDRNAIILIDIDFIVKDGLILDVNIGDYMKDLQNMSNMVKKGLLGSDS